MRLKTCKACREKFKPDREFQNTCGYSCAITYAKQLQDKREAKKKKDDRIALREFKKSDKPTLLQSAQKLVNQYIRMRDNGLSCVSCEYDFSGYINNKVCRRVKNAGHYIAVSKSSFLRFNENNVNLQCSYCNDQLASNSAEYRKKLIKKIGIKEVEYLEANKTTLKTWTVKELQEVITIYEKKIKGVAE